MSIYVVDDHPLMRDAIGMVLRRAHPEVRVVEVTCIGELMVSAVTRGRPELILLDLNLPDAVGCSGVSMVKRYFPDVPLAVYSASPADEVEDDCIGAGADLYIEKSVGLRELLAAFSLLSSHRRSRPPAGGTSLRL